MAHYSITLDLVNTDFSNAPTLLDGELIKFSDLVPTMNEIVGGKMVFEAGDIVDTRQITGDIVQAFSDTQYADFEGYSIAKYVVVITSADEGVLAEENVPGMYISSSYMTAGVANGMTHATIEWGYDLIIEWDGNIEGLDAFELSGCGFYKVSDIVLNAEHLNESIAAIGIGNDTLYDIPVSVITATGLSVGLYNDDPLVISGVAGTHTYYDYTATIPSDGTYFFYLADDYVGHTASLKIAVYEPTEVPTPTLNPSYLTDLFIQEAKPALDRHSGSSGTTPDSEGDVFILVDEAGNEATAVYVEEATVFDATANDIRSGKTAATESGVTLGTKDIPAYHLVEGYTAVPNGEAFKFSAGSKYDYTSLQAILCPFSGSMANSVAADKVVIGDKVYAVNSTEPIATVTKDSETQTIDLGISNDSGSPYVLRYFGYKEEY